VKYYVLTLAASFAMAQSVTNTYITDVNGHRIDADRVVSTDHTQTRVMQTINGNVVPMLQTEERVLRREGNTTVREKIVRNYDRNGNLASTDRELIEEQARPGGSLTRITRYQSDVNGRFTETERRTTETETQGSVTRTQSTVDRPTINGSFHTVEKKSAVTQTIAAGLKSDETTYQRSENGGFNATSRLVTETQKQGAQTTEKTALYQPFSDTSNMRLTEQTVSTITAHPDGSESVEKTLYGSTWNGQATDNETGPQLRERDYIERKPGPGNTVTESLSVRRPTVSDPNKLGPLTKISETVCTGKCEK
jgi:hypothetical protein